MKKTLFLGLVATAVFASCNQKSKENSNESPMMMNNDSTMMNKKTKMMESNTSTYACPMHPEVHGEIDEKCSKCGMALTEPVVDKVE